MMYLYTIIKTKAMNKEYALEILESVERKTLECNCSLAEEAYRYLEKLKSSGDDIHDRIYTCRHNKQW